MSRLPFSRGLRLPSMFKKKSVHENKVQLKASAQRGLIKQILTQYHIQDEHLFPKKVAMFLVKSLDFSLLQINSVPLFIQTRDHLFPTLKVLHHYPGIMKSVTVDRGAIKFVLKGADIMCPGMTHKDGRIDSDIVVGDLVAIHAAGKVLPMGIGLAMMSHNDIVAVNKGVGIQVLHFLNDELWKTI